MIIMSAHLEAILEDAYIGFKCFALTGRYLYLIDLPKFLPLGCICLCPFRAIFEVAYINPQPVIRADIV